MLTATPTEERTIYIRRDRNPFGGRVVIEDETITVYMNGQDEPFFTGSIHAKAQHQSTVALDATRTYKAKVVVAPDLKKEDELLCTLSIWSDPGGKVLMQHVDIPRTGYPPRGRTFICDIRSNS